MSAGTFTERIRDLNRHFHFDTPSLPRAGGLGSPDYVRIRVTETLVARTDSLAWQYGLRGYDAVHLAAALLWQEGLEESVTLATFDRQLWEAGKQSGLAVFPADLA
jgi:hypothetical protein